MLHEHPHAPDAGFEQRLADRRKSKVTGDLEIVVTEDRQIRGHIQAEVASRLECAERLGVTCADDAGRRLRQLEEALGNLAGRDPTVVAEHGIGVSQGKAGAPERHPNTAVAKSTRRVAEGNDRKIAEESDPPMTQFDEVAGRDPTTCDVVHDDP